MVGHIAMNLKFLIKILEGSVPVPKLKHRLIPSLPTWLHLGLLSTKKEPYQNAMTIAYLLRFTDHGTDLSLPGTRWSAYNWILWVTLFLMKIL